MRLNLSENAAKQLGYTGKKTEVKQERVVTQAELDHQAEREAKREKRRLLKQAKVTTREAAFSADRDLQVAFDVLGSVEQQIQKAENRLTKDREDYDKRVERKRSRLQNVQRQLENLHAEMLEAQKELATERKDVPASIEGMDALKRERAEKVTILRGSFDSCEQAFKNPNLTKSAKSKRNTKLRRVVKEIISNKSLSYNG